MTKEVKTMRQNVKLKNRATLTNTVKIIILRMGMIKEKWLETRPTPRPIPFVVVPESPSYTILSVIMDPNCVFKYAPTGRSGVRSACAALGCWHKRRWP